MSPSDGDDENNCNNNGTILMIGSNDKKGIEVVIDKEAHGAGAGAGADADFDFDAATAEAPSQPETQPETLSWPEDTNAEGYGIFRWAIQEWNVWTYSYMNTILKKGAEQNRTRAVLADKTKPKPNEEINVDKENDTIHLTNNDLYSVPREMKSSRLVRCFETCWENNQSNNNNNTNDDGCNKTKADSEASASDQTRKLFLKSLWRVASPTFLRAGVYQFVSTLVFTTIPLIIRRLLLVLEDNDHVNVVQQGLRWAILYTIMTMVNGLVTQRYRHQSIKTGIVMRSTVVNIIYKHVLALSPEGKRGLTSGEINNLIAVDAQKLYEVTQEGHLVWALPLSVGMVTWFLWFVMGPSTLVGIMVLIAFLPMIKYVSVKMTDVRAERVKLSDQRIDITIAMLMGMRTTKLNGYESKYAERVAAVRKQELRLLAREQAWWATTLTIMVCSPVLATAFTFSTYVWTSTEDDPHILTAADTFGALLLFGALRFPINFAGKLIGQASQALSAIRRIVVFLERPLRKEHGGNDDPALLQRLASSTLDPATYFGDNDRNSIPLVLTRARFRVGIPVEEADESSKPGPGESKTSIEEGGAAAAADGTTNHQDHTTIDHGETETITSAAAENGGRRYNLSFTVGELDFELQRGEVMVVCGPVGSGKSTLLNGILEEAEESPLPTEPATAAALNISTKNNNNTAIPMVQKGGRISYAPQDPFIQNLSLRENILFGSAFDRERYNRVLDACALRQDIEQLGGSDLVQIGERGVTLSGGQRQRISLARAAYKEPESACLILDDPFSALDSGTGRIVFEKLIAAPDALLRNSAVLLVTHASHFISHKVVDKVLLMVNGKNEFLGTWEELATFNHEEHNEQTRRAVDHIQSQVREDTDHGANKNEKEKSILADKESLDTGKDGANIKMQKQQDANDHSPAPDSSKEIMQKEIREYGLSSMKTWFLWFQRAGGVWFGSTVFILLAIDRFFYVAVEWFLAVWTEGALNPVTFVGIEFPAQIDGSQGKYLKVFFAINVISILMTAIRSNFVVTGGVRATNNVFNSMVASVLRAPMSYFETVPMGRILNRFTYDTDVNDVTLTQVIAIFIIACSWYIASIVVQIAIIPWSALALLPVSGLYFFFVNYYRMTGPDLQRIDALSRSPMQSMISECLEGSTSIRIFQRDKFFVHQFENVVDVNSSALLNYVSIQRWLGVRMEVLGALVVMAITFLVVCLNDRLETTAGLAGLIISWSLVFTFCLNFLVQTFSDTEAAITAIERVDAMADLPSEKPLETPKELRPPPEWPQKGLLEFRNISLRYRQGLPLALNDLSFVVPAGKTCGIVGRTGAGKSSITVALFRLVEIELDAGSILLDGVDLTKLGLSDVRGRGMSIIPQDPFLAGANLRESLDPFEQRTDSEILEALESVRMGLSSCSAAGEATSPEVLLATKLEEGGSNYSVGERQLLNLARALLSQPRVLVLDEATASIDGETDEFIQKMLRTRFPQTTLLTIAHRLNTIMDYDCVLVMDAGRASEFDAPANLLDKKKGIFSQLVDATGSESSKALRQLAIESRNSKLQD